MALHVARHSAPKVGLLWVGGPYAAAQTNLSLIAAPGLRRAVAIDQIYCSSAAACVVTLLDGSGGSVIWRADLTTNHLFNQFTPGRACDPWPICTTENIGLFLTTTYAGNHSVLVLTHIESW